MPSTGLCASSPIGSANSSGRVIEFGRIRNELARDRIVRIVAVDQRGEIGRQRDGVARGNRFDVRPALGRDQAGFAELRRGAKSFHDSFLHYCSVTGAQITCSMRVAPVASITSRSKPSAMPDAGGICASAARKSSSTG